MPTRQQAPPPADRAARRREGLISAAYDVVAERGYRAAGVPDITSRAGVAHGTFYRYFDGKRDVFDHVFERCMGLVAATIAEGPHPGGAASLDELMAQVEALMERVFDLLDEHPRLVRVLLFEATAVDEAMTERVFATLDALASRTAAVLDEGIRDGYLREGLDTLTVAQALHALALPTLLESLRPMPSAAERRRVAGAVLDFVRASIAPER
jgi:AcrR family transcriptional regulator